MWEVLSPTRRDSSGLTRNSIDYARVRVSSALGVEFKSEPIQPGAQRTTSNASTGARATTAMSLDGRSVLLEEDEEGSQQRATYSGPLPGYSASKGSGSPPTPNSPTALCAIGSTHSVPVHLQAAPADMRRSSVNLSLPDARISRQLSKMLSTTVNFRDVCFTHSITDLADEGTGTGTEYATLCTGVQKNKLIIILVGLPGRGKTFLCNKLMCYLNWLGHPTRHFNVGQYRRKQKEAETQQDAGFFDHSNPAGLEARMRALNAALDDLVAWLESEDSQVAILDATNSTHERRMYLRSRFHGRWQYLMIESVCDDEGVLRQNYLNKLRYSPDYTGMDTEEALADFKARIKKYEEVYETITDRSFHYIKLTDMPTGRGHLDLNRISGYLAGKLVSYIMQVCKAGQQGSMRKIWLTRHGQSEYNRLEKLGGDSSISEDGERYAALLPACLLSRLPKDEPMSLSVWTSTLKRTIQTARNLPFPKLQWKALDEIGAGLCDGMTYEEIAVHMPEEYKARKSDKLRYRYPAGESYLDVVQRLEPVITEIERERESVVVVSHQAVLRVIYGYFMGVAQERIPTLEVPLHTLIELTPMPDGTMLEQRFAVNINAGPEQFLQPDTSDMPAAHVNIMVPEAQMKASCVVPVLEAATMDDEAEARSPSSQASTDSLCAMAR